jgi:hypothetical protein
MRHIYARKITYCFFEMEISLGTLHLVEKYDSLSYYASDPLVETEMQ